MANYLINSRNVLFRQIFSINALFKSQISPFAADVERGSIILKSNNPFDLFNEWFNEANSKLPNPMASTFIMSNYSPERKVRSRVMMYTEQKDDKFTIFGSDATNKIKDLKNNSDIAMCFVWSYTKDNDVVVRQVRITGRANQLSTNITSKLFDKFKLPLRIEWSKQNEVVLDWKQKQEKYTKMNHELKTVPMPSYKTGFEVTVNEIKFFHNILKTTPIFIADRVLFTKEGSSWHHKHIGA